MNYPKKYLIGGAILLALTIQASVAATSCSYCPDTVVLSKNLGACYLQRYEHELKTASESGLPVYLINLSDCLKKEKKRWAITMPDPQGETVTLDGSFLIEPRAMICLAKELEKEDFDPEEIVSFQISGDCVE